MLKLVFLLLAQNASAFIGYKVGFWQKLFDQDNWSSGSRYYTGAISEYFLLISVFKFISDPSDVIEYDKRSTFLSTPLSAPVSK